MCIYSSRGVRETCTGNSGISMLDRSTGTHHHYFLLPLPHPSHYYFLAYKNLCSIVLVQSLVIPCFNRRAISGFIFKVYWVQVLRYTDNTGAEYSSLLLRHRTLSIMEFYRSEMAITPTGDNRMIATEKRRALDELRLGIYRYLVPEEVANHQVNRLQDISLVSSHTFVLLLLLHHCGINTQLIAVLNNLYQEVG